MSCATKKQTSKQVSKHRNNTAAERTAETRSAPFQRRHYSKAMARTDVKVARNGAVHGIRSLYSVLYTAHRRNYDALSSRTKDRSVVVIARHGTVQRRARPACNPSSQTRAAFRPGARALLASSPWLRERSWITHALLCCVSLGFFAAGRRRTGIMDALQRNGVRHAPGSPPPFPVLGLQDERVEAA